MNPHRTALQSIMANLKMAEAHSKYAMESSAYREAMNLVRSELARADQLASQPTGDGLIDGLARLRRMELEGIAALEDMIAKLDEGNRKPT
jgi:hypothetical protein